MAQSDQSESAMLASCNVILLPFAGLSAKAETDETRSTMSAPPVEIADLPDELLMSIFKHAKGGTNIGNVRLSCRRFRDTSSHLLLDILNVCLTPESLARAQEISRHPAISKGIRVLHIGLCPLSPALLSDSAFLSSAVTYLHEDIRGALQYTVKSQNSILDCKESSLAAHFVPLWKQRKRLLRSWGSWDMQMWRRRHLDALSIFDSCEQTSEVVALRRGYEKYKNAYEWQQRTLGDGTFVQVFVRMMERMPMEAQKENLELFFLEKFPHQEDVLTIPRRYPWRSHSNAFEVFDDRMIWCIGTSMWDIDDNREASFDRVASLTIQVPLAIHAAGLKTVGIGFHSFIRPKFLPQFARIHKPNQLLDLRAAVENLRGFRFSFERPTKCSPNAEEEDSITAIEYLRTVLGAANLQFLIISRALCCNSGGNSDGRLGPLLASLPWPHLRAVNLTHVSFHLNELKTFIGRLQPGVILLLRHIRLRSGGWAEGLDILRTKANSESQIHVTGHDLSSAQYRRIFDGKEASWASRYIQGESIGNPFLVIENET